MIFYRITTEDGEIIASCHTREQAEKDLIYWAEYHASPEGEPAKLTIVEHEGSSIAKW